MEKRRKPLRRSTKSQQPTAAQEPITCTTGPTEEDTRAAAPLPAAPLVLPLPHKPPKHVAIVAMGTSMAAFTQLACGKGGVEEVADEIWTINATAAVVKHHRAFVMDDLRLTIPHEANVEKRLVAQGILKWLPKHPGPVYTSTAYPEYPALVEFPLADALNATGGLVYLNTTVAYAIAYAFLLDVEHLSLYGCDFTYPDLHAAESGRGCVEWLLATWCSRGKKLTLPSSPHATTLLDWHLPDDKRLFLREIGPRGSDGNPRHRLG